MAYRQAQDLSTRLQIIQILCGATHYYHLHDQISEQTKQQIESDYAEVARFFSEEVVPVSELPILDRISEWLRQTKKLNNYERAELDQLQQQLKSHEGYQLYRLFVGGYRWYEEDEELVTL
ncbi:MAG: hypothetical protein ACLFM2_13240 [Halothece sp.]